MGRGPRASTALFTLGFDPLWIGILIALVLQTSFITPPFGFSLFYLRGVLPKNVQTIETVSYTHLTLPTKA